MKTDGTILMGDEYKCLSIVNHDGIFIQFLGMCEKIFSYKNDRRQSFQYKR
jgi:hypothetical protein